MVNPDSFQNLLEIIKEESTRNTSTQKFYDYLLKAKPIFYLSVSNNEKSQAKEIIRNANRYADEFEFSENNYVRIRAILKNMYENLAKS